MSVGAGVDRSLMGKRLESGLMLRGAEAGGEDAAIGRGGTGLATVHDEEILLRQAAAHVAVVGRMPDVRIDRAAAVTIGSGAADAPVGVAGADRPVARHQRRPPARTSAHRRAV